MTKREKGMRPRGLAGIVWDLERPGAKEKREALLAANPEIGVFIAVSEAAERQREFAARLRKRGR